MTIKQQGGIFGRNPTFNDVDVEGTLTVGGSAVPVGSDIASLSTANEFTQEQEIKVVDATAYDASAADAQVTVGPSLFLNNPANTNSTVAGQVVFGLRSTPYYARLGATGGSNPNIFVGLGTSEIARFTSNGLTFNGDTAAANALDDYEEGTWTPVFADASSGGNVSPSQAALVGTYTKVGNLVVCRFKVLNINTSGMTAGNDFFIRGFPFLSEGTTYNDNVGTVAVERITFTGAVALELPRNQTYARLVEYASGADDDYITVGEVTTNLADITATICYTAA